MVTVHFFASVREALDQDSVQFRLPADVQSVRDLMRYLDDAQPGFRDLNQGKVPLLVAVNHTVADQDTPLEEGDEVAFFPPMTGG